MATFYILYSKAIDNYYIGFTDGDIQERLSKHLVNHKGFTSKARDWKIIYTEKYNSKEEALKRESQVKGWKSRKMIEKIITEGS